MTLKVSRSNGHQIFGSHTKECAFSDISACMQEPSNCEWVADEIIKRWNTRAKSATAQPQSDSVIVPRELLDRFPEINMANFGADEVELLNDWGIEVYLLGGDQPAQPTKDPLEWSRKHGIEEF